MTAETGARTPRETDGAVDFKMVTFSLGGKDYGVDIMNVKEIARADKFTFVPNAAPFVRGVYNLRGDIIPVIDLRVFFHVEVERAAGPGTGGSSGTENMLILRVGDRVYGTIVDRIDKVVGLDARSIQPPHPIFGDVNAQYISGVVERGGSLYVILDAARIFGSPRKGEEPGRGAAAAARVTTAGATAVDPEVTTAGRDAGGPGSGDAAVETAAGHGGAAGAAAVDNAAAEAGGDEKKAGAALAALREKLPSAGFYPSPVNEAWLERRAADAGDVEELVAGFQSPDSGRFWGESYAAAMRAALPDLPSNSVQVWDIGCGKGYEAYSLACILRDRYPRGRVKIWANDRDIMAISQAPNLLFDLEDAPEYCRPYMVRGKNGYVFNQAIRDSIVFEYHDALNDTPLPDLDVIVARDVLSCLAPADQERLVDGFGGKLKRRGVVFLGRNEVLPGDQWRPAGEDPVSAFTRA